MSPIRNKLHKLFQVFSRNNLKVHPSSDGRINQSFPVIRLFWSLRVLIGALIFFSANAHANPSPEAEHFFWDTARKDAVGTAYEEASALSPVWWTVAKGRLSEIYYPQIDNIQVAEIQVAFLFADGSLLTQEDLHQQTNYADEGMLVQISMKSQTHLFQALQKIVSDPEAPRIQTQFTLKCAQQCPRVFVYFKPAIQGKGSRSFLAKDRHGVLAYGDNKQERTIAPAQVLLRANTPWKSKVLDYANAKKDLKSWLINDDPRPPAKSVDAVGPGQVVFLGELALAPSNDTVFELSVDFFSAGTYPLEIPTDKPWTATSQEYTMSWKTYRRHLLTRNPWLLDDPLACRSAQILKMHGDKRHRGAYVAAFSIPGIPDLSKAYEDYAGYHLVWPRDLYHIATGFMALHEWESVREILNYLREHQRPSGAWPQNFWLDGTPSWTSLQLDEVSYPILLADELARRGLPLVEDDFKMISNAAKFISENGPRTPQERWEELGGYSPNVLAVEVAALRAAGRLLNNSSFINIAIQWNHQIENWTEVKNGTYGSHYFLRISPNGTPSHDEVLSDVGGRPLLASSLLDLGFLDLARWGVRAPTNPIILKTLNLIDTHLEISSRGYYRRYNGDRYGWQGQGGYWPLLTGERAEYECQRGEIKSCENLLLLFNKSQTSQGHLPEQIIRLPQTDPSQNEDLVAPNSASPLAWSHAGYLRAKARLNALQKKQ